MSRRSACLLVALLLGVLLVSGCQDEVQQQEPEISVEGGGKMELKSSAFGDGESIPSQYSCDAADISPPLSVSGVPPAAETLALVVDDPDAPGGTFVHWVIWNLPADTGELPESVPQDKTVASLGSAAQGKNDFGEYGYRGPCPPGGEHRYQFHLYAVGKKLELSPGATKSELLTALKGSAVAEAELTGLYSR